MECSYEYGFLFALLETVLIETAVLFFVLRAVFASGIQLSMILFAGITASALTLPYLWFLLPALKLSFPLYVILGELSVTIIETIFYLFVLRISLRQAFVIAFCCNLISFSIGWITG